MQKRIRRIFTCAKEKASVSYAKIATNGGFCDIDFIIVKATSPDDLPLLDRYVLELLKIFSISPSSCQAFVLSFTRRFGKTESWRVALKCLVLLHRLLRSVPDGSPFRADLLWARANGLLSLNPCYFRDRSSSSSEDYTAFIQSYAHLLDEALNCVSIESQEKDKQEYESFQEKMEELGRMVEILPQLQTLIDRVISCWPTGSAARSFIVQSAMKYVIRDSFTCYTTYRKEIVKVLDNLIQLPYPNSMAAFSIYKKAAIQADQLCKFYDWCRSMGFCGFYEYPFVDRIPEIQIRALESFLDGMWQLTDVTDQSSSSAVSTLASTSMSPTLTEDDSDKQLVRRPESAAFSISTKVEEEVALEEKTKGVEMEPLIQWTVDDNVDWENLLEASINASQSITSRNCYFHTYGYAQGNYLADGFVDQPNGWQMQVYIPNYSLPCPNPFYEPGRTTTIAHGSYPSNPMYPWGL
ncbi:clathrin assembly At2g25430 [Olea europaea subsp. europaea]|uniref:Clathrin assembly At2g25430 n=1 Tax=Olea europaea subsp. europaea TaxID=158383 RepID=A0A8S0R1J9_OLEEU|nr:clathrin assembly At2g25430 [Olea europaea subsp. europaea]